VPGVPSSGAGSGEEMKMSETGLDLLKQWEGVETEKYKDAGGKWTIGVGHLLTREEIMGGKYDDGITEAEALELLAADVGPAEDAVNRYVAVPLNQNQFDALCSMVFNIGASAFQKSTLLKVLNDGDYDGVPEQMLKWVRAGRKILYGLVNRRNNEIKLWHKPLKS